MAIFFVILLLNYNISVSTGRFGTTITESTNDNANNGFIFEEIWSFDVLLNGCVIVSASLSSLVNYTIYCRTFYVPQTAQDFSITGDFYKLSNTTTNLYDCKAYSFEIAELGKINISYNWPDGAIYYDKFFYFAGEENPPVVSLFGHAGKDISFDGYNIVNILLPESAINEKLLAIDFFWFEFEHNKTLENDRLKISYIADSWKQLLPIIKYQVEKPFQIIEFSQKNSSHFIIQFHPSTVQWMDRILEIAELGFEELEILLEYTPDDLPITISLVPVGSEHYRKIIGEDVDGFGGSGKVFVRGDYLFGIAENKRSGTSDTLFHEIVHCFQPLDKNPPDFFSEGLATLLSVEMARLLNFTEVSEKAKQRISDRAFEYKEEVGDYSYIWMWEFIDVRVNKTLRILSYYMSAKIWEEIFRRTGFRLLRDFYKEICSQNIFNDPALSETTKWCYFVHYLNSLSVIDITDVFQKYGLSITTNLEEIQRRIIIDYLIYYSVPIILFSIILFSIIILFKKRFFKRRREVPAN